MSFTPLTRIALTLLATAWGTSQVSAQTTYFGLDPSNSSPTNSFAAHDSFQTALLSFGTDTMEGHPSFSSGPTLIFGATSITGATGAGTLVADFTGQSDNFSVPGGVKALLEDFTINDAITLSATVNAFGFFITQAGDAANVNTISLLLENTALNTSWTVSIGTFGPGLPDDSILFFGLTDHRSFDRVTVQDVLADGILFDNLTVGFAAVPEPGSIALITAAAGAALWMRYRYQRRKKLADR